MKKTTISNNNIMSRNLNNNHIKLKALEISTSKLKNNNKT